MTAMQAQANGGDGKGVDRREGAAKRMPFEAMVEVGGAKGGGFEAESVDVSLEGIRLRTAYMPAEGETIVCRFDGVGGEVIAEGEVIWRREEGRGGEFGVRFNRLDKKGAQLLKTMSTSGDGAAEAKLDVSGALPGSRVRLHIQGLGSPMRARVRDVASGEVLIGSNLEFLKVGRGVELEDVEQGATRQARIEHVTVDIDKETAIPQLVVSLRYDGEIEQTDETTSPYRVASVRAVSAPAGQREKTPEPTVVDADDPRAGMASMASRGRRVAVDESPQTSQTPLPPPDADASDAEDADDDREHRRPGFSPLQAGRDFASKLAPKLAGATRGTKNVISKMLDGLKRKRAQQVAARDERVRSRAPKRTTAPPPSGALRSDGKRLIRQRDPHEAGMETSMAPAPRRDKKRLVLGLVLGVVAVACIYAFASTLRHHGADDPSVAKVTAEGAPAAGLAAAAGGAVPTAKVPLFGDTPLSTTEPVPAPPDADLAAGGDPGGDSEALGGGEGASEAVQKEWGVGDVVSPTVLKLKMDGTVDGVSGSDGENGFTIKVPGRKFVSNAAGLAKRDKRLADVNIVNYPDHCEITVLFKGETPAFRAKANGKRVDIEIGSDKGKAGASKSSSKKKAKAKTGTAKKSAPKKSTKKKTTAKK